MEHHESHIRWVHPQNKPLLTWATAICALALLLGAEVLRHEWNCLFVDPQELVGLPAWQVSAIYGHWQPNDGDYVYPGSGWDRSYDSTSFLGACTMNLSTLAIRVDRQGIVTAVKEWHYD